MTAFSTRPASMRIARSSQGPLSVLPARGRVMTAQATGGKKQRDNNPFAEPANRDGGPASSSSAPQPSTPSTSQQSDEARLELLEASVRGNKRAIKAAKRAIPIKGMANTNAKDDKSNMAPWQEGKLVPDGWEQMSLPQKVTELYMGRRGLLFWANKAAYASVFILIGGWVLFRFVGPNLGLYTLQGDFAPPPL